MLNKKDIFGFVDDASRTISQRYPAHRAHIAIMGSRIKKRLQNVFFPDESSSICDVSQILDMCTTLEQDENIDYHSEILTVVQALQSRSVDSIIALLYREKKKKDPTQILKIRSEEHMAYRVSQWLRHIGRNIPDGFIGPEWIQEHSTSTFYDAVLEYIFDLEKNTNNWERFVRLLPTHLQQKFDENLIGMDVPTRFDTESQALSIMQEFARRKHLNLEDFGDPDVLLFHIRKYPVFKKVLSFFALQFKKRERGDGEKDALKSD